MIKFNHLFNKVKHKLCNNNLLKNKDHKQAILEINHQY